MSFPRLRLKSKLLLYFITISGIPLIAINILWFMSARTQVINSSSTEVLNINRQAAQEVNNYLSTKIISLIIHSQTNAILSQDIPRATLELKNFINQDRDIEQIQLLNKNGKEVIKLSRERTYTSKELTDQSSSSSFKVTTFVGGSNYISQPFTDARGNANLTIAIPVVISDYAQNLQDLSTSSVGKVRQPGEIFGVLIETIYLNKLWSTINNLKIGSTGYVFVVDDKGNVLAHPDANYITNKPNVKEVHEVKRFLLSDTREGEDPEPAIQAENEKGVLSLSRHEHVPLTNWGVIAVEPVSDTLADISRVSTFALILFFITMLIVVLLSLGLSTQLVHPIDILREGSRHFGSGNLEYRISLNGGDEIEELGNSFNSMASKLQESFGDLKRSDQNIRLINAELEKEKEVISAEKNKLSVILSGISDAIISVDLHHRINSFNSAAEKITGWSSEKALGKPIHDVIRIYDKAEELLPEQYSPIGADGKGGIVFSSAELRLETDQKKSVVRLIAEHISEGPQVDLGCILSIHDITEERQLEEMKLDFVSMAAHELRTPLTSIRGYLSVYMEENVKNFTEEQHMFLNRIQIATDQLVALVENLLNVTRIERGAFTVNLAPVDWVALAKQATHDLESRAHEKKIHLSFIEPSQHIKPVMADKLRITEVITNLVANAISYTAANGSVTVSIEQHGNEVITHVVDTGEGIPSEALPHLFTKFFRVSGKLAQGSKGTGLGLYISKAIVEMHKGRIWVQSEVNRGSTFSFSLPGADDPQAT